MLAPILQTAQRFPGRPYLEILIPGPGVQRLPNWGCPRTHKASLGTPKQAGEGRAKRPLGAVIWAQGFPVSKSQAVSGPPLAQSPSLDSQTHKANPASAHLLPRLPRNWSLDVPWGSLSPETGALRLTCLVCRKLRVSFSIQSPPPTANPLHLFQGHRSWSNKAKGVRLTRWPGPRLHAVHGNLTILMVLVGSTFQNGF